MYNEDIVDELWERIQDPGIQTYLASLKVDYMRNPRGYKIILQDIATEIAGRRRISSTFVPRTRHVDAIYSRKGTAPESGVHKPDGSIFIGGYDKEKWDSEEVQPHHKEITEARAKNANKGQEKANKKHIPKGLSGKKEQEQAVQAYQTTESSDDETRKDDRE